MPREYYPEVFGGQSRNACEFGSLDEANELLWLMMRRWHTIAGTVNKDEVYVPLLLEDEDGVAHGNDWARGFMRGMGMRHDGWAELVNDEKHGGCLIPMMMLYHEHGEDRRCAPSRSAQRSAKKSSYTWRLGFWGCIGISGRIGALAGQSQRPHERTMAHRSQGRAERSVPTQAPGMLWLPIGYHLCQNPNG